MNNTFFELVVGDSPIVGAAIHCGHEIRPELNKYMALNEMERLREEDPYTDKWAEVAENTIKVFRSRFEVDLNRTREKAVYLKPEDAWGLQVWKENLPSSIIDISLAEYDSFYDAAKKMLSRIYEQYGYIIVLDIHTYNHKREGADGPEANPKDNPEVNIGTSNMNREHWAPVVDGLIEDLEQFDYAGRTLDVRENVKFKGGFFSNWVHSHFPESCSIAIEFKKFFMNEWTGEYDSEQHKNIYSALEFSKNNLLNNSEKITCLNKVHSNR